MPITPASPWPKQRGDTVRSADWNQAVNEVIRLDNAKVNRSGDTVTGALTVNGGIVIPDNSLSGAKLANNSVPAAKIPDNSLPGGKLQDNTLPASKIPDNTLPGAKLQSGSVDDAKLAQAPGLARAWGCVNSNGTLAWGWNVASVSKPNVGQYVVQVGSLARPAIGGGSHIGTSVGTGFITAAGSADSPNFFVRTLAGAQFDTTFYFVCF